jgi:hypothetical protein
VIILPKQFPHMNYSSLWFAPSRDEFDAWACPWCTFICQ